MISAIMRGHRRDLEWFTAEAKAQHDREWDPNDDSDVRLLQRLLAACEISLSLDEVHQFWDWTSDQDCACWLDLPWDPWIVLKDYYEWHASGRPHCPQPNQIEIARFNALPEHEKLAEIQRIFSAESPLIVSLPSVPLKDFSYG
jgi:hypothetical protein